MVSELSPADFERLLTRAGGVVLRGRLARIDWFAVFILAVTVGTGLLSMFALGAR